MKKISSKFAYNEPKLFFSVFLIGPKPAQITFSVPYKCLPAQLLYNDFVTESTTASDFEGSRQFTFRSFKLAKSNNYHFGNYEQLTHKSLPSQCQAFIDNDLIHTCRKLF